MSATSLSPPPRMPSPHQALSPLPSPPILPRRTSRQRLHLPSHPDDPPIPPRLVGSPLLKKMTVRPTEPHLLSYKAQAELWIDGDEFGTFRRNPAQGARSSSSPTSPMPLPPSSSPRRLGHRRSPSIVAAHRPRSHSPPPMPALELPPPVPPIPSSALAMPGAKRAVVHSRPVPQIHIPNLDCTSQLTFASPPKRNSPQQVLS